VANPPQFIVIGSDDNTSAEAIRWMAGVMAGKRYDESTFSATNADGSKRRMTFYVNSFNSNVSGFNWENNEDLVAAVSEAYRAGHSIGNHTHTHPHFVAASGNMSIDEVREEITLARDAIRDLAGVPVAHQFGFRTPFLAYHDGVFTVLRELGFMYDHSIEAALASGATRFPYTLDDASPDNAGTWWANPTNSANIDPNNPENTNYRNTLVGKHPGLWVLLASNVTPRPVDVAILDGVLPADRAELNGVTAVGDAHRLPNGMVIPNWMGTQTWGEAGFGMTGFDYNLWSQMQMDEEQTYNALMNTLNMHLNGNRAPFSFGPHSQYFFQADNAFPRIDANGRRRAFERFVEDASKIENVFFVTSDMVIRWMNAPVSADNFDPENFFVGYTVNGFIAATGISGVPSAATVGVGLPLTGVVAPASATNKTITWSVENAGTTGATITGGNTLNTTATGTATIRATITNGASETTDFTRDFQIVVSEAEEARTLELIGWEHTLWDTYADGYGSVVSHSYNGTYLQAKFELAQSNASENIWPYLGIGTYFEAEFMVDLKYVEITYTASAAVRVGIGLATTTDDVDDKGDPITATYSANLPAGTHTEIRSLAQFVKPSWTPDTFEGPVNLSLADMTLANGIIFFHETYGTTVDITVNSIKLIFGGSASINPQQRNNAARRAGNSIQINNFRAGNLNLNVGQSGLYTVSIHDVSGRVLAQTRTNLVAGTNSLSIGQNLARGIAIVRIEGANATLVRRISVR
jgi:peptidoglycan/xylan/chitin deacetylase (PgdA/CDA1 family)